MAARRLGGQRQASGTGWSTCSTSDEQQRRQWLDRRQPAPHKRANWWLYLLLVIDQHLGDQSRHQRADWAELKLWLLRQGQARAVFTEADSAEKLVCFARDLRRAGIELAGMPSADDIVRACLDALPVGLNEVAILDDQRNLSGPDRTQMRHSRQAKNLVSAAEWHLDGVQDARLAAHLREWIDIRPRLA